MAQIFAGHLSQSCDMSSNAVGRPPKLGWLKPRTSGRKSNISEVHQVSAVDHRFPHQHGTFLWGNSPGRTQRLPIPLAAAAPARREHVASIPWLRGSGPPPSATKPQMTWMSNHLS